MGGFFTKDKGQTFTPFGVAVAAGMALNYLDKYYQEMKRERELDRERETQRLEKIEKDKQDAIDEIERQAMVRKEERESARAFISKLHYKKVELRFDENEKELNLVEIKRVSLNTYSSFGNCIMTNIYDKYLNVNAVKEMLMFLPNELHLDKEKILNDPQFYDVLWYLNILAKVFHHKSADDMTKDSAVVLWVNMVNPKRYDDQKFCDIGLPITEYDIVETLTSQFPFHVYGRDAELCEALEYKKTGFEGECPYRFTGYIAREKYHNENGETISVLKDFVSEINKCISREKFDVRDLLSSISQLRKRKCDIAVKKDKKLHDSKLKELNVFDSTKGSIAEKRALEVEINRLGWEIVKGERQNEEVVKDIEKLQGMVDRKQFIVERYSSLADKINEIIEKSKKLERK